MKTVQGAGGAAQSSKLDTSSAESEIEKVLNQIENDVQKESEQNEI